MELFYSSFIGYLLGSIPTAFILLKYNHGLDIRNEGSGNVGTLNSYEVTNSKLVGFVVLAIDLLKGLFSVIIVNIFFESNFLLAMFALIFAVFGHCYSPWIQFKGGRGLATAAGGILLLAPTILFLWLIIWVITYSFRKDIHFANISATSILIIISVLLSSFLNSFSFPPANENFIFGICVSLIMVIIISKHLQPLKIQIQNYKKDRMNQDEKS